MTLIAELEFISLLVVTGLAVAYLLNTAVMWSVKRLFPVDADIWWVSLVVGLFAGFAVVWCLVHYHFVDLRSMVLL